MCLEAIVERCELGLSTYSGGYMDCIHTSLSTGSNNSASLPNHRNVHILAWVIKIGLPSFCSMCCKISEDHLSKINEKKNIMSKKEEKQDFTTFNTVCFWLSNTACYYESKFNVLRVRYFLTTHFGDFTEAGLSPT